MNVPNHKKVTNAVPKNKKSWIAAVKQFLDLKKIIRREFARMYFSQSRDKRKGFFSDYCLQPKNGRTRFSKCHMTNGHVILGNSAHKSPPKGRQLGFVPQHYIHIWSIFLKLFCRLNKRKFMSGSRTVITGFTGASIYATWLEYVRWMLRKKINVSFIVHFSLDKYSILFNTPRKYVYVCVCECVRVHVCLEERYALYIYIYIYI